MDRTYNFQVDNGLFVAEYYLKKDYKDITIEDLKSSIDMFGSKLRMYNELGTLSSSSHINSALSNPSTKKKEGALEGQLNLLLDSASNDKNCMICGKKQVNIKAELPYASLLYGLPSHNAFLNRGNNMKTVDVCPVCLFLGLLSFLNTQKISFPFLYNTDSDEFMRDITEVIQSDIQKNIMLDMKIKELDKKFLSVMNELKMDEQSYDDLTYIELVNFQNGKTNLRNNMSLTLEQLNIINKIKNVGLVHEFYDRRLFRAITREQNLLKVISRQNTVCSQELYNILKEDYMTKKEIELVESITKKLMDIDGERALRDLKMVKGKLDFKQFLISYSNKVTLCDSLTDYNAVIENCYDYTDYLILNLNLNLKGDNDNE